MDSATLLFVRERDIWAADNDGKNQRRLVRNASSPSWSPDRTRFAFARDNDLWIARADGSGQRAITRKWRGVKRDDIQGFSGLRDLDITWDPIGKLLVFHHWERFRVTREGERNGTWLQACTIFSVPIDGSEAPTPFLDVNDDEARFHPSVNACPTLSRDGKRLAFVRNGDIWLAERVPDWPKLSKRGLNAWAWDVRRIAALAEYDAPNHWRGSRENYHVTHLTLSPDGTRLAYVKRRINGSGYLDADLLLSVEASEPWRKFKQPTRFLWNPCFSRDGSRIAYDNLGDVYADDLRSSKPTLLVRDGRQPAW